jgi:uncharacterized protein (TIGR03435 family)
LDAYGIPTYRLSIPDSFKTKHYDIVVKIPDGTSKEQFNAMLQNLLADRFGLRIHRQPREFSTYKLVIGSRGPKLQGTTLKADDPSKRPTRVDPDGVLVIAGVIGGRTVNGRFLIAGGKITIGDLAKYLEMLMQSPVTDATGLTGEYDIRLQFSPEGLILTPTILKALSNTSATGDASDPAPNISQALEQQLGLRLEKTKVLLDVIVVDHLDEVPSEN